MFCSLQRHGWKPSTPAHRLHRSPPCALSVLTLVPTVIPTLLWSWRTLFRLHLPRGHKRVASLVAGRLHTSNRNSRRLNRARHSLWLPSRKTKKASTSTFSPSSLIPPLLPRP